MPGPGGSLRVRDGDDEAHRRARAIARVVRGARARRAPCDASAEQRRDAIGIEAEVPSAAVVTAGGCGSLRRAIAVPGNRRAAEIERHPVRRARRPSRRSGRRYSASLAIGVASVAIAAAGVAASRPAAWPISAGGSNGSSPCTLTTMSSPAQPRRAGDLGDAIRAGRMVSAGHLDRCARARASVADARIVGRDHDFRGAGAQREALHVQDHRLAGEAGAACPAGGSRHAAPG